MSASDAASPGKPPPFEGLDTISEPDRLARYAVDGIRPSVAVLATDISDVEQAMADASAADMAVVPHGGRTMQCLGMPPQRYDAALDLSRMNRVVDYEPEDFTITVEAGMTLSALQQQLAINGQFLPLDHPHFEQATLGGLTAVGRGGLRRNSFGGPRDWLIGMRMVQADGTAIKAGGKVVKNVSGYDLAKLFAGSLGTLGIIVELTFKLRPQPASDQIIAIAAPTFIDAQRAARAAAETAPFLNGCIALSADAAAEARALGARVLHEEPTIVLRANGLESAATEVLSQALSAVREAGLDGPERRTSEIVETWQAIADLELQTPKEHVRLRLGLPPANLVQAQVLLEEHLINPAQWIIAADSGLLFVSTPRVDADTIARLRRELGPLRGRLTIESAPPELKSPANVWGPAGAGARLMHNIKKQFDPHATLNPGRFVDGI